MKHKWPRQLGPLAAGVFLSLLAGGLLAPGTAWAGCSHYVVARGHGPGADQWSIDNLEVLGNIRLSQDQEPPRAPRNDPSPCAGLSCSRDPMTPLAPAPSRPLRAEAWAHLHVPPVQCVPPGFASPVEPSAGRPTHLSVPLDRPPRTP